MKQAIKQYFFLNISFLIAYTMFYFLPLDIYAIFLYIYLLAINIYYYFKIEKLIIIINKDWEYSYSRQVRINNILTEEILKGEMKN